MAHHIFEFLRDALIHYGYWAIIFALLLENAGIPVPGETILLLASFLAYSRHELQIGWIIVAGTLATTASGGIGFVLGLYGGRSLLDRYQGLLHINPVTLARGERLFERYGPATVFFARFIFGLRVLAALLAGALRMPWRSFLLYNFLGSALWVTVISGAGYLFGRHWERLMRDLNQVSLAATALAIVTGIFLWSRNRRRASSQKDRLSGI